MKRAVLWLSAVAATVALTVLIFLPATWLGEIVEQRTQGRLTLGDAQGTLWRGSAYIGGAAASNGAVTPLLPGRFSWRLSPLALLGQVDLQLENPDALSQPVTVSGTWSEWQVSPATVNVPAERLAGLGAPLNTLAPSGAMQLSWSTLGLARAGNALDVKGRTMLAMNDMGSRMAPVKPLGSYELAMDWNGQQAQLNLRTVRGALLLSGTGSLDKGRFQFAGQAEAADGYEETLGNLLSLLGQRRMVGGKNIIALEFK
ncbi:type II secretion system protein N [Massilia sp. PAMC28688]|uniref:type II secretion system protein N n=1 Tax=Massilia sp. PAMC28688 TaxID=2861283 RepID=UPI001C633712|nr:type II secretion system protein N [Massilia sp. PAMC28688]QYF94991.1 type II secretion system protein N [Massilia sp. PAMC28688]